MIPGEVDGVERAANLMYASGRTAKRPMKMIFPLECDDNNDSNENVKKSVETNTDENDDQEDEEKKKERSTRKSAIAAREKIRNQINC